MIISGVVTIGGYMKHGAPPSVPTTPTNLVATAQTYTTANVTFTTGYDGGATASYTVVSSPGNITVNSSSNVIGLTGLTSGTTYTFTAYATNIVGNSANSANSNQITMPTLVNATGGTTYTGGPYRYHVFNTSANLTVISGGQITVMMVGGGGGGGCSGGSGGAGGGGAGGVIYAPAVCITAQPYVMTVGAGGFRKGANTIAFCMTALGGGAGVPEYGWTVNTANGGSGGGGARACGCARPKGISYQNNYAPPGALVYGNDGGVAAGAPIAGAGGGGAGAAGGNAAASGYCAGGQGGDGIGTYSTFLLAANSGINVGGTYYIAGGGGGGSGLCFNGNNRRGGYGGGGAGGANFNPSAAHSGRGFAGNVNTGGGGGGASRDPSSNYNPGGCGGSGVVIIKYQYQ
jgi:hypothetical protein